VTRHSSQTSRSSAQKSKSIGFNSFLPVNYLPPLPIANIYSIPYVTGIRHRKDRKKSF
jgi:hypothetical protein